MPSPLEESSCLLRVMSSSSPSFHAALQQRINAVICAVHGTSLSAPRSPCDPFGFLRAISAMHEIIYLIGLVVVVMFILGALGLR